MCIRDRLDAFHVLLLAIGDHALLLRPGAVKLVELGGQLRACLLYTSDAADERSSVDLGGRRIIKKKISENDMKLHVNATAK